MTEKDMRRDGVSPETDELASELMGSAFDLLAAGEPFELYEIDNRDTMLEEEFLTEIQMRVERAAPDKIQEDSSVEG